MKNKFSYYFVPVLAVLGLAIAGIFYFFGSQPYGHYILMATLGIGTLPLVYRIILDIIKGRYGVDLIAITAIVSSFILKEYLAGTVILLMLSGGEALEAYALQRARKELSSLISRAPSIAHKMVNGKLTDIPAKEVMVDDVIIVKPGEVVPVDGVVIEGISEVDESALTGEPLPVEKRPSSQVLSGGINKHEPLQIRAVRPAHESKYEQIIKLIKEAEESRAPMVRLADRYSVWFTAITFSAASIAWLISHDPVRLLAVLVVATPCPLILATPIAIISGISQAASRGIIVKSGGALEKLGEVKALIFDKTGTLTLGAPKVVNVEGLDGLEKSEILKLSASLDQMSAHVLAVSLTKHAVKKEKIELIYPKNFKEFFGDGVSGEINGKLFHFGKLSFLESKKINISEAAKNKHLQAQGQGTIAVYLANSENLLGIIYFADVVRPEIKHLIKNLYSMGLKHIVMLTGDKKTVAEKIGAEIGLNDIHAEALPEDKVWEVKDHQKQFGSVAMIGDGINDAPALACADVGISIGAHGSTAASDSGDIVITVDDLTRVGTAVKIAKHVLKIAKQGIFIGIGLSIVLMIIASLGYIKPVFGALLQELLDVIVIFNALRVNFEKIK